jgi:hypothetical protein
VAQILHSSPPKGNQPRKNEREEKNPVGKNLEKSKKE